MFSDDFLDRAQRYDALRKDQRLLAIKVSAFYRKKTEEEHAVLGHWEGPLARIVYPSEERIFQRQKFEVDDYVKDRSNMPEAHHGDFIHKYSDRVLFLPQTQCLSHCMYCFRQDILEEDHRNHEQEKKMTKGFQGKVANLCQYLAGHPEVSELILSGGDPMMLSAEKLEYLFTKVTKETKVIYFRLHTRSLVFEPRSFSDAHRECMLKHRVRVVLHVVHPYEICESVRKKIIDWNKAGVRLYNQFPILRKINDHSQVLIRLITELDELGVRTLSAFFPDPVQYSSAFRIHFSRLIQMVQEVQWTTPSWVNAIRFTQDTEFGKVGLSDLEEYDEEKGELIFLREGQRIIVPDHPIVDDEAGELRELLWKDKV